MRDIDASRFVDQDQAEHYKCPICKDILDDPCLADCGHTFCFSCLNLTFDNGADNCPMCGKELVFEVRNRIDYLKYQPNWLARSVVDQLKVRCAHQERGCPETPELCSLEAHLKVCPFAPKCQNCEQVLVENHKCRAKLIQTLLESDDNRFIEDVYDFVEDRTPVKGE